MRVKKTVERAAKKAENVRKKRKEKYSVAVLFPELFETEDNKYWPVELSKSLFSLIFEPKKENLSTYVREYKFFIDETHDLTITVDGRLGMPHKHFLMYFMRNLKEGNIYVRSSLETLINVVKDFNLTRRRDIDELLRNLLRARVTITLNEGNKTKCGIGFSFVSCFYYHDQKRGYKALINRDNIDDNPFNTKKCSYRNTVLSIGFDDNFVSLVCSSENRVYVKKELIKLLSRENAAIAQVLEYLYFNDKRIKQIRFDTVISDLGLDKEFDVTRISRLKRALSDSQSLKEIGWKFDRKTGMFKRIKSNIQDQF